MMWSSALGISAHKDSKEIYFIVFGHSYKFILIFKVRSNFY
jgi:hypothetical protein